VKSIFEWVLWVVQKPVFPRDRHDFYLSSI
jgi:hypothetical protein